jgi:pimeloyl-ACP methyl ester carboxylesterase
MPSFTSFDGTHIAYQDEGDGPAVILLHGIGVDGALNFGSADGMLALMAQVPEAATEAEESTPAAPSLPAEGRAGLSGALRDADARVIVIDMRGHGASDRPHDPAAYRDSAMARDVAALLDHLEIDRVDVLGYSMGAVAATHLLALGEPRLRSVILAGIGQYILEGEVMNIPEGMPGMESLPRDITFDAWAEHQAHILDPSNDESGSRAAIEAIGADPDVMAAVMRGMITNLTPPAALRGVSAPVLVLNGDEDIGNLGLQASERLLTVIPDARFVECEGNHMTAPFYPSFQQAVVDFFKEGWRKDTGGFPEA